MSEAREPDNARAARLLLRASRAATLATATDGQPFASLVTPAATPDGSVLMLLSDLSEHTRHLRQDSRCALMVVGTAETANPQTAPRLTLIGTAAINEEPSLRRRWVALHPYAAFYAGFGDFNLWRMVPASGHYIGGFASAHRLGQADLMPKAAAVTACEAEIVQHCNADHRDALDAIAIANGTSGTGWSMVACDPDGFDLVREHTVLRIPWPAVVDGPHAIRKALIHLAGAARNRAITTAGPAPAGTV